MKKRLVSMDINDFPKEIQPFLRDVNIYDSSSNSFASVYYLDSGLYLKVDDKGMLKNEAALTQYFFEKGLGVELVLYLSEEKDYMLTRSATGEAASYYLDNPERLCEVLANALLVLHSQTTEHAPVSSRLKRYLDSVDDLHDRNFDETVLLERFGIHSKQEAVQIIEENWSRLRFDTLIHGDACLANIILQDMEFSSFIDFNMAGRGDKHVDLYWVIWSLKHNLKEGAYIDYFLDAYGRERFDYDMLRVIAAFESIE